MTGTRQTSVHHRFQAYAHRTPEAVALTLPVVTSSGNSVTYGELDRRAGLLAARLAEAGVRTGDLVGVAIQRGVELVVAQLAILRAGAAYVPLDPTYPQGRLEFIARDAGLSICVGAGATLALSGVRWLDARHGADHRGSNLPSRGHDIEPLVPVEVGPEAPAYLMYTSGSTGQPKGVAVPHRAILRLVTDQQYARLDETRAVLHLAPPTFDAATFEVWGPLLNGGRCVIAPPMDVPDLALIGRVIREGGVTTAWLTASLFNATVDRAPEILRGVEEILTGGEALSVPHVRRAQALIPGAQLVNGYGPTESTTFACCYRIPNPLPADLRSVPIGKPLHETVALVLDEAMQPVPPGVEGELHLGGSGLALGYWGRPELTAERFVADPFGVSSVGVLYRTGDRARLLPSGDLEFCGRRDDQVKIRGHRIELGEVESVLRGIEGVRDAAVVVGEDGRGDRRLACYWVPDGAAPLTSAEVRARLEALLPAYMIPARFVVVESLPTTSNGKLDRASLPAPGRARPQLQRPPVAARTPVEAWVAARWCDALDLDEVGVHDRFFELGGTSLTAMTVLARLSEDAGRALPALLLFRAGTVAEMADLLEREHADAIPSSTRAARTPAPTTSAARAVSRAEELRERRTRRRHG